MLEWKTEEEDNANTLCTAMATAGCFGMIRGTACLAAIAPQVGIEMLVIVPIILFEKFSTILTFVRLFAFVRLEQLVTLTKSKNMRFNMTVSHLSSALFFSILIAEKIIQKIWPSCAN